MADYGKRILDGGFWIQVFGWQILVFRTSDLVDPFGLVLTENNNKLSIIINFDKVLSKNSVARKLI